MTSLCSASNLNASLDDYKQTLPIKELKLLASISRHRRGRGRRSKNPKIKNDIPQSEHMIRLDKPIFGTSIANQQSRNQTTY